MNKFFNTAISLLAVLVGIGCAVAGIVQFVNKDKFDTPVTAVIVDIQEEWETATTEDEAGHLVRTAYIEYEVNGVKYGPVAAPVQNDTYSTGDMVEILCQSSNPEKISDPDVVSTALLFVGLGSVVAFVGCVLTVKSVKAK